MPGTVDPTSPHYPMWIAYLVVGACFGGVGALSTGTNGNEIESAMEVRVHALETKAEKSGDTLDDVRVNQLRICHALKVKCKE